MKLGMDMYKGTDARVKIIKVFRRPIWSDKPAQARRPPFRKLSQQQNKLVQFIAK